MIKPAILYKDEIIEMFQNNYYTDAMTYNTGGLYNWCPNIQEEPDENTFQFAIVNKDDELLGFITYKVDWYVDKAYNFGMLSKQEGNPLFGKEIFNIMEELVKRHHRIEWSMVGGNPVERSYDKFCSRHGGTKFVFKDSLRDREGNYRNSILYEIVKE